MRISTADFLLWRECLHNAWLKIHEPAVFYATPLSAFDQTLIETGKQVEALARELFPGGQLLPRGSHMDTWAAIRNGSQVLYQPTFAGLHLTSTCDILVRNRKAFDLYEVKSSTDGDGMVGDDDCYLFELGFQAHVMREAGIPISRVFLVRLNSTYVRRGALNREELFTREDVTRPVFDLLPEIGRQAEEAWRDLSNSRRPPGPCKCMFKGRSAHCSTFRHTNPQVPDYSVHDLARIGMSPKKLDAFWRNRIVDVLDIPADFKLTAIQRNQVSVAKSGQPIIDHNAVARFLDDIEGPVSFLDYETFPAGVPRFDGYTPFAHAPFQWSLHVMHGGKLHHAEFLFTEGTCPDEAFIYALRQALPDIGSVIVWNKVFEQSINTRLAERNPKAADFLKSVNDRLTDLEVPFRKQWLVHPEFRGKTSLKVVSPALAPGFSYDALAIKNGATAGHTWDRVVSGKYDAETAEQKCIDLLHYCRLDTLVMVKILGVLNDIANRARLNWADLGGTRTTVGV